MNGKPALVRTTLRNALGAKLPATVVIVDKKGNKFRERLRFDVASLWTSGQLPFGPITAACRAANGHSSEARPGQDEAPALCRFDGTVRVEVPQLAGWKGTANADVSKLQLVLNGSRIPGVVPRYDPKGGALTFDLLRFPDKPDSVAAWDSLRKTVLASRPGEVQVALADERSVLETAPTPLRFDVVPYGYRLGFAFLAFVVVAVGLFFVGKRSAWSFLRDDFAIPDGVLLLDDHRAFSLGKVQMAAWTVAIIVGCALIALALAGC